MEVYYVADIHDDDYEVTMDDVVLFSTREDAVAECSNLNAESLSRHEANTQRTKQIWEEQMAAYTLLREHNMPTINCFPYLKNEWRSEIWVPKVEVRSIEVKE